MDLELAQQFLTQLAGHRNPIFAFRTFQDNKSATTKNPALTNNRYGPFVDIQDELVRLNAQGAGIFFTVQKTDGQGYSGKNITQIRACFVDLDGAALEPVSDFKLKPQIIIESSPKRYHAYWLVDETQPMALPFFEIVQTAIAEKFSGDKTVKDLPRVMRLPGFLHRKDPSKPFMTTIISTHDTPPRYSAEQILTAFSISPKTGKQNKLPIIIPLGQQETRLVSFLGSMRRMGASEEAMMAAIQIENQRCKPPVHIDDLKRMVHSVAKYEPTEGDFLRDKDGKIYPNNQTNIKIGLEKLNLTVKYNVFADQFLLQRGQNPDQHLDDIAMGHIWLEGDEAFRFRPSKEFFTAVVMDQAAHKGKFHPVLDYFKTLEWDGKPRIDDWLIKFGGAEDSEYVRTIGRLVLLAAVRRVKQPGVMFQEMLVMESQQGKEKSSVLKALCPNEDWFSDSLPLDADPQRVIEQTAGKWIVEVAELSGMKKSDIEHVKGFLSRTHDVARKAYDRMVTTRPRHFIMIGTTNSDSYLKDTTGNRRFWPVKTPNFSAKELRRSIHQIWAEAVVKEAEPGTEIQLPEHLWAIAAVHQEQRRQEDPWEMSITQTLDDMHGRIAAEDVWKIVGVHDTGKRSVADGIRLHNTMQRLGFSKAQIRIPATKKRIYGFVKGVETGFIKLRFDDGGVEAYLDRSVGTQEWEQTEKPVEAPKP